MKEPINWIKNKFKNKTPWFLDGDEFLIAVQTNKGWEYAHIKILCDEDYFDIRYANSEESYDAWQFADVDFYIPVGDTTGPLTEKQMERIT